MDRVVTGATEEARRRLLEWSNDDLHVVRSVRFHEPVYANPGELRADVRTLLSEQLPEAAVVHPGEQPGEVVAPVTETSDDRCENKGDS